MSSSGPLLQLMLLVSLFIVGMALLALLISFTVAGNSENTEAHSDSREPRDPQMLRMRSNDSLSWLESLGLSEYFIVYHPRPHPYTHTHIHISSPQPSPRSKAYTHTHARTHVRTHLRTHILFMRTLCSKIIVFSLRARFYGIFILYASDDKKSTTDTVCC